MDYIDQTRENRKMEPITAEQLTNLCQEALAEVVEEVRQQPAIFHLLEYKMRVASI